MSNINREDKLKQLESLRNSLEKEYGKTVIRTEDQILSIPRWKLSSPSLSDLMGGGLPKGRIIELYGTESGGKTTLALLMARDVQKEGGHVLFVDAEYSFDYKWANKFIETRDPTLFGLITPDSGNDALEIMEKYVDSGVTDLIIVDSVSALVPEAELDGNMGDASMGTHARLMSQAMRKLTAKIAKNQTTIIFINQIRMKIGVMFGNPEETTGGKALKFYSSIRLDVRKGENLTKGGDDIYGIKAKIKCVKNKTAPPFKKAEVEIDFNNGIDIIKEYISYGVQFKIIEKAGAWYSYKNERLGQGLENAIASIKEDENILKEIIEQVDTFLYPDPEMFISREKVVEDKVERKKGKKVKKEEDAIELSEE